MKNLAIVSIVVVLAVAQRVVDGRGNVVEGAGNVWRGQSNSIRGSGNDVIGDSNSISGSTNYVRGNNNQVGNISPSELDKIQKQMANRLQSRFGNIFTHFQSPSKPTPPPPPRPSPGSSIKQPEPALSKQFQLPSKQNKQSPERMQKQSIEETKAQDKETEGEEKVKERASGMFKEEEKVGGTTVSEVLGGLLFRSYGRSEWRMDGFKDWLPSERALSLEKGWGVLDRGSVFFSSVMGVVGAKV